MLVEEVRAKRDRALKESYQCSEQWQQRMQLCLNSEGAILWAITNDFLNCVNKKVYSISLVIFVSVLVCECVTSSDGC
jgi:hypothetical protein